MTKKTLVLTENFPPLNGGSGRWFWELYSRLPQNEYLIIADEHAKASEFDQASNINILRLPLQSSEWGFKSLIGLKYYWRTFWALKKIIKQHEISHIHCGRVIHEGVTAWLLSLFTNIKYTCYVHGEDVETAATSREHNLIVSHVCKRAQKIICNSQNSQNIVTRLGYATPNKIEILHPAVDANKFIPAAEDHNFKQKMAWENRTVLLTVGRLQRRKGQDLMIQAMPELIKQKPDLLYCIIGGGELEQELKQNIKTLGLTNNVKMLSEISDADMIKCYQQCDLFILPNRTIEHDVEGFGMVLVEAQSCGKPVIAGDSGGTKETMQIGKTGFVIDCTSPEKIAVSMAKILANKELKEMGNAARTHIEQNLNWQAHVTKAKQIFKEQ